MTTLICPTCHTPREILPPPCPYCKGTPTMTTQRTYTNSELFHKIDIPNGTVFGCEGTRAIVFGRHCRVVLTETDPDNWVGAESDDFDGAVCTPIGTATLTITPTPAGKEPVPTPTIAELEDRLRAAWEEETDFCRSQRRHHPDEPQWKGADVADKLAAKTDAARSALLAARKAKDSTP
jgi:hypothetical protein